MNRNRTYDQFLASRLEAGRPDFQSYRPELSDFHEWVRTAVDAQATYTDLHAPPSNANRKVLKQVLREQFTGQRMILND